MSVGPDEMVCPICGTNLQPGSTECGSCGAIFPKGIEDSLDQEHVLKTFMLLPGIGLSKAQALYDAGFRSIAQIRAADKESLMIAKGLSEKMAHGIKEHIESGEMERHGLYLCPECGAFISEDSNSCPKCGVILEDGDDEEDEGVLEEAAPETMESGQEADKAEGKSESKGLFLCPGCGAFISSSTDKCYNCGLLFEEDEEDVEGDGGE
ncbi:MAG: helix-hairpin-helix domain-containing protein, partial [Candidatus Thermoplasmatota archaeon]|nr:helix-hairpin-helix domain-containing protein [Candidatus Thermoplasmatota archaeon]